MIKISRALFMILCQSVLLVAAAMYPAATVMAHSTIHVVQPDETLSTIAAQYATDIETLRRLNSLSDTDFVWIGQTLVLPDSAVTLDETSTETYTVRAGDNLSSIAVRYQTTLARLAELNHIAPSQRLYTSQSLIVPTVANLDQELVTSRPANQAAAVHIVQRGEHLGMIAAQYDVTERAIAQTNDLANASLIVPGQRLLIPASTGEAEAVAPIVDTSLGGSGYHTHTDFPTTTEKWIDVDLSEQRVVAYVGTTPVNDFIISSGLPGTPTVTGTFRIWAKTPLQDMSGGNRAAGNYYYLKDVQWVQYFYKDYGLHGTYWHNNFGQPMSRGCINMTNDDAKWLFDWAGPPMNGGGWLISSDETPGTLVLVHE
jgi:LysM repeat protein